jgi:hypothetical protein
MRPAQWSGNTRQTQAQASVRGAVEAKAPAARREMHCWCPRQNSDEADFEKNKASGHQKGTGIAVDQFVEHVKSMK